MKQHYVPAFYLRAFTDPSCRSRQEPYVWVVDLNEGTIRRRAPENTAALTDYYTVGDGEDRNAVEEYLGQVETLAKPVIRKILDDSTAFDGSFFDAKEKAALSVFAAVQVARVPGFRNRIEDFMTGIGRSLGALVIQSRDRYEGALRQAHPGRDFSAAEVDNLYRAARTLGPDAISANPEAALGHALRAVPTIANLIEQMSFAVMMSVSSGNFWTSDNPVFWINPDARHPVIGHGLSAQSIEVNLPIGPKKCLLMTWIGIEARFPIHDLRCAQERGIAGATRYLFCSTEGDAAKTLLAHRRMYPNRS